MHVATTKQSRNFVKAYHDVLESTEINSNEKLVYLFLLSYQEAASVESIFPSNEYIAQRLGLSVRTVIRATATLAEAGLIAKTRRFNKSNTFEVTNCHVWTCQTVTSGRDKLADYKNRVLDQREDQLLEEEGQNPDASLSHGLLDDTDLTDKPDFIGDESVSDLNLAEQESEQKEEEEVIDTYASMHSESLDCSSRDYSTVQFDDEPDLTDDEDSGPVGLKTPEQSYRDLLHTSANRVTALNKKPKQYNRSQSYRSNPNY